MARSGRGEEHTRVLCYACNGDKLCVTHIYVRVPNIIYRQNIILQLLFDFSPRSTALWIAREGSCCTSWMTWISPASSATCSSPPPRCAARSTWTGTAV